MPRLLRSSSPLAAASRIASRTLLMAVMLFLSATAPSRLAQAGSQWTEGSQVGTSPFLHSAPVHRPEAETRTHRRAAPSVDVPEPTHAVAAPVLAFARGARVSTASTCVATARASCGYDATAPPAA